jgi:BirA family biotin operon repressor/biotin-[acetyl-CoA-carboxylase] ligase
MIKHVHVNECDSTQNLIKEQLSDKTGPQHILVSCENQTAGRGRGDKTWLTMPGTLCFSLSVVPHAVTSFTALELSVLIAQFFKKKGKEIKLKWPNDLLIENKKCCGILIQSSQDQMFAGIGVNLFSENEDFAGIYETEFEIDKKYWSHEIAEFIYAHRFTDTVNLKLEWMQTCSHINEKVTITESDEVLTGIFVGLGEHGEALLKTSEGIRSIYNGTLRLN